MHQTLVRQVGEDAQVRGALRVSRAQVPAMASTMVLTILAPMASRTSTSKWTMIMAPSRVSGKGRTSRFTAPPPRETSRGWVASAAAISSSFCESRALEATSTSGRSATQLDLTDHDGRIGSRHDSSSLSKQFGCVTGCCNDRGLLHHHRDEKVLIVDAEIGCDSMGKANTPVTFSTIFRALSRGSVSARRRPFVRVTKVSESGNHVHPLFR